MAMVFSRTGELELMTIYKYNVPGIYNIPLK